MAKVGEGDPRWVVENREDGRNVNNWHWSETDCINWSKKKFQQLLGSIDIVDNEKLTIKTASTVTVTGECTSNNRKGKTIFLYEMEVKVSWDGTLKSNDKKVKGDFVMPYISDENADERAKVNVTLAGDASGDDADTLKEAARKFGIPILQEKVVQYVNELKEQFSLKKPAPASPTNNTTTESTTTTTENKPAAPVAAAPAPTKLASTKSLKIKEEFQASPMDAYDAFVNPNKIRAYTQSDCVFEDKEGGKFALYGGFITGTNVQLSPGAKIVQKWRLNTWADSALSNVTITFSVGDKPVTLVEINQTGIPTEEYEKTEEGWRRNIIERMKMVFGFGSRLY